MIVFYIDIDSMSIKSDNYTIGNLMAFYDEMDQLHPDGWFDNYEDAQDEFDYFITEELRIRNG